MFTRMIVKQCKHTAVGKELTEAYLETKYADYSERIFPFRDCFRCAFIVMSNRPMDAVARLSFQNNHPGSLIIDRDALENYFSRSLSSFGLFDSSNDNSSTEAEMEKGQVVFEEESVNVEID